MLSKAVKTRIEYLGRPVMLEIQDDRIEMWRMGERTRRSISIEEMWSRALIEDRPQYPVTQRSGNSIVAHFSKVRGMKSYWVRLDTGEELTEAQLRRAGRIEKRPVVTLFGSPAAAMARGGAA